MNTEEKPDTDSSATETLVATSMQSTDGTKNWQVRDDDASTPGSVVVTLAATTYQGSGQRRQTVTYPDSSQMVSEYQNGRPSTITRRNSSGGTVGQTSYAYDEHGRTETVTDLRNGAASYTYNNADQVLTTTTPAPSDGSPPQVTSLTYDSMGRQTISLLPDGTTVANDYNDLGLVIKVTGSRTYPVEYTYDPQGRMATMKTWQDYAGGTGTATTTWHYDSQRGWLEKKVYQGGTDTTDDYEYKSSGRLWKRHWERGITTTYAYIQANQRTRMSLADGSYWVYQYDQLGQVISGRRFWADGTPVAGQQFEYGFDDIGNRTSTGGRESAVSTYTVNLLNQYDDRTVAGKIDVFGIANPTADVTVETVDAARHGEYFHSVVSVSNGSVAQYPQIDVVSEYGSTQTSSGGVFVAKSPEPYTHDTDGNLTQDGRWVYVWDGENRLAKMRSLAGSPAPERRIEFEYDWQGRRIRKKVFNDRDDEQGDVVSDTVFLYDGWNLIAELSTDGESSPTFTKIRTYVWGNDLSGSMQGAGGVGGLLKVVHWTAPSTSTHHFVSYDGNGNVMGLVDDSDGMISARYEYGPFAEPLRASGAQAANPFRFSTKYCDDESGVYYYIFRYYSPITGQFVGRDPIGEVGGVNVYVCVLNDPISYVDTDGMQLFPPVLEAPPALWRPVLEPIVRPGLRCPAPRPGLSPRPILEPIVRPRPGIPPGEMPIPAPRPQPTPPGGTMPPLHPPVPIIPSPPGAPSPTPIPSPDPAPSPQPSGPLPPDQGGPPWQYGRSDCEPAELAQLEQQMHAICDQPRSCRKCKHDFHEVCRRILINEECIKAREHIMKKCYRGGDAVHKAHVDAVREVLKVCNDAYYALGAI